ncbi:Alstrom syndrome protein 1 homolog a-like isoform X1 [Drosophila santomea]|uniref:Alstrom syndrome protein 1 homolog a-like isoform X1 n=1 Tax=Drosophila santomea TaxID=129105 RepID=UPI001954A6E9|nr:Alstrom syndrome protein 1 homolog a-like isoform X1 [Drosophila santomea]
MSSSRHRRPTKSSRVPPQAREYISAMAEDRELERFMAFSSTASSAASGSTHSCALGSVLPPASASMEHKSRPASGRRRRTKSSDHPPDKEEAEEQLQELPVSPPISKHTIPQLTSPKSQVTRTKSDEYTIIPIVLASSPSFRPVAATQTISQSAEDLRTPTKSPKMQSKKTQTPESALKSHKRLEWDPAADVGYYKRALSTSNISTLERSVLEDCGWRQPTQQRHETDADRVQRQEAEEPSPMPDKPTPPLACSTFVNRSDRVKPLSTRMDSMGSSLSYGKGDSRQKSQSKSKREDSGGSSRQMDSRSSSRKESNQGSSKEKDKARGATQIDSPKEEFIGSRKKEDLRLSSCVQDPQISSRRASMISSRRESLSSYRRDDSRLNSQNSSRLGSHVSSRAENSRSSSRRESQATSLYGSSATSSFDYHIHMEQEVQVVQRDEGRQKEKEDEPKEQLENEQHQKDVRQGVHRRREQRDKDQQLDREQKAIQQRKAEQREKEREQEREYTATQFEKIWSSRRHENKENQQPQNSVVNPSTGATAIASTSSSSIEMGSGSRPRGELDLGIDLLCSLVKTRSLSQGQKKKLVRDIARRISCLELAESSTSLRSLSTNTKEQLKVSTGSQQRQDAATNTTQSSSRSSSKAERITLPVPAPRKRGTAGTPSPLPVSLSHSGSTSASRELITQKTNVPTREAASTDAEAEPSDSQEWLNPMTQSEIEYEQRLKGGADAERRKQLNWIDTEIRRLEALQKLLFNAIATLPNSSHIEADKESERPPMEYLLPQGMPAEVFEEVENPGTPTTPPLPMRIESAGMTLRKLPQTPTPPAPPPPPPPAHLNQQKPLGRKKMATPVLASSSSTSGGGRSESVCSFVQQRQRQFREHYQNQQQQQLLLLQQQKLYQQQKQLNQQKDLLKQKQQQCAAHCEHCGHQRTCVHQQHCPQYQRRQQETQKQHDEREQYMQMQYAQAAGSGYATPLQSGSAGYSCADNKEAIYYQVVNSQGAASYVQATMMSTGAQGHEASATGGGAGGSAISRSTTTTTSSSTSMMCISSDMSIPMGMVNTCETTTTTTTHQYDDVACQRVRRLRKETRQLHAESMQRQTLQVRPRAIAYAIQFTPAGDSEVFPETRSLQDQLQLARPEFCAKSKQRKAILNQMQMIRNHRRQELDNLLCENTSLETLDRRLQQLPPPATSRLRVFTTREMKAMTTKRCQSLPEVMAAQSRQQEERRRRCNRLMRDVFNKRLQNRVANGQISLNHSAAII